MSLLNFESSGPAPKGGKKSLKIVFGIGALVGVIAIGSTLAASINLNGSNPVEFGQGVTQTTPCDDEITLTPYSTFVNAQGGGTFMGTSIVISDVDSSADGCGGKSFTITGYGDSSPTPIAQIIVAVTSTSPWFIIGDVLGATLDDVSSSSFTITLDPNIVPIEASEVSRFTIESKDSTESTPVTYSVGERGPGGGIVYYVSANFFTSTGSTCDTQCKYLEVAPATWQSAGASVAADLSTYEWSDNTSTATGQDKTTASSEGFSGSEKANWQIGKGFSNTSVMRVAGASSAAQAAVLAYAGGSTAGQWFIPSMNELNELCKYARGQTTGDLTVACVTGSGTFKSTANAGTDLGGFEEWYYWSSSEFSALSAWYQIFTGGYQDYYYYKLDINCVRPVRAF